LLGALSTKNKTNEVSMTQLSFMGDKPSEFMSWTGNRERALERLELFLPRAGRAYTTSRNYDFGPNDRSNVSCMSPWLRYRLLREQEVLRAVLSRHSYSDAEKLVQEVLWRTYFKGWLEHHPSVWSSYRKDIDRALGQCAQSSELNERYASAMLGETGIECFDAWAKELIEFGYLHNHARMWFASIWIFTLQLPWQLGADFFLRNLLDADPASNTLSWRWVAGLHTRGKNYIARASNIEKYSGGRFSPSGLVNNPAPLREDFDHPFQPLATADSLKIAGTVGLIITEDDCNAETLTLPKKPVGICGLHAIDKRSPLEVGKPATTFAVEVLKDALQRSQEHFECPVQLQTESATWGPSLVTWAQNIGVKTLVTAWVPIGPAHDKLTEALPTLQAAGIRLLMIKRRYDELCWPHAASGFFKLKKKIPALLGDLNII
jgi:deoxyribodipyrimidine photo-lyase